MARAIAPHGQEGGHLRHQGHRRGRSSPWPTSHSAPWAWRGKPRKPRTRGAGDCCRAKSRWSAWNCPPGNIQIQLLPLLTNRTRWPARPAAVDIADGRNTYLLACFPGPRAVGQVLQRAHVQCPRHFLVGYPVGIGATFCDLATQCAKRHDLCRAVRRDVPMNRYRMQAATGWWSPQLNATHGQTAAWISAAETKT